MNDYFKWSEFKAEVLKLLPIEANRVGVGATDYLDSLIVQAVIDLQRVIPGFQINHETIYYPDDMVVEGKASRLVKPPQSAFKSLSLFKTNDDDELVRHHSIAFPYEYRFQLINGQVAVNDKLARHAIDDAGYTMYVYPVPADSGWHVSLFWDGQKFDFDDDEQVPFTQAAAFAVSLFVQSRTTITVENDVQMKTDYAADYAEAKKKLYLDDKDKRG